MKTSLSGIHLIKSFEGLRLNAYVDAVGVWTVGYGHTGPEVVEGKRVTEQQAESLLKKDVAWAEDAVADLVKIPLNQNQFDALVSFTYNNGVGAFKESTLLKRLNNKEDPFNVAKEEMPRWCHGEGGKVLQGLVRRRMSEVELFCQAPAKPKTGTVDITSRQQTWFKKEPISVDLLLNEQKAKVYQGRTIKNSVILDRKNKHTLLELGFKLGKWWVFDDHWSGLYTETGVKPYAVDGKLRYLRNFPYFWQQDNGPEGWRQCQSSSIAMILKYLGVPGIEDDKDYLKYVLKHGSSAARDPHYLALKELKVHADFRQNLDAQDIKEQIDKGLPVSVGILHHGHVSSPIGGGHFIVITGYSDTFWLVQDPYGELDLVNGVWTSQGAEAGKNQHYSFENLNKRLFVSGDSDGWGWVDFRYPC